jgi:hypothetical protein
MDWMLVTRLTLGSVFIYFASFERNPWALAIVLFLTMLASEAAAYSIHGPRRRKP